jgi:hypothetical protein
MPFGWNEWSAVLKKYWIPVWYDDILIWWWWSNFDSCENDIDWYWYNISDEECVIYTKWHIICNNFSVLTNKIEDIIKYIKWKIQKPNAYIECLSCDE